MKQHLVFFQAFEHYELNQELKEFSNKLPANALITNISIAAGWHSEMGWGALILISAPPEVEIPEPKEKEPYD